MKHREISWQKIAKQILLWGDEMFRMLMDADDEDRAEALIRARRKLAK